MLIVDNEPTFLLALKKLLSAPEMAIDTAETLEEAMALIEEKNYQVIIADLRLTGVLGEEGLKIIQYVKKERPQTKLILITGYGSPEVKEKVLAEGADFYFEKPVSFSTLQEALVVLGVR